MKILIKLIYQKFVDSHWDSKCKNVCGGLTLQAKENFDPKQINRFSTQSK